MDASFDTLILFTEGTFFCVSSFFPLLTPGGEPLVPPQFDFFSWSLIIIIISITVTDRFYYFCL